MQTTTAKKPVKSNRSKPVRFVRLSSSGQTNRWMVRIKIVYPKKPEEIFWYYLERIEASFGQGFRFEKLEVDGGGHYDVNLDGQQSTCECKGYLKHRHCKHIECLTELQKRGKLAK